MNDSKLHKYHQLFGDKGTRIVYKKRDSIDYLIMMSICILVINLAYGAGQILSILGTALCVLFMFSFIYRYGFRFNLPAILRKPQDVIYTFVYKFTNMKWMYVVALLVLGLENYLIAITPDLPHRTELMHQLAIYMFYGHLLLITFFRTVILVAHLRKKELVSEVLLQSSWKGHLSKYPSVSFAIFHAYFTGLLTHIILISPWFIVITFANFSVLFLPVVVIANFVTQAIYLKVLNSWYYREHWLGHNSELDFLYLHGSHHDAIPSGLIGVAGNGFLEGFLRHSLAFPTPFFNPFVAFLFYTVEIRQDILTHQYIPGVYPQLKKEFQEITQHSTHHFGQLEPYGFGIKIDQPNTPEKLVKAFKIFPNELKNSAELDEQLTNFKWDNPRFRWYMALLEKYQK